MADPIGAGASKAFSELSQIARQQNEGVKPRAVDKLDKPQDSFQSKLQEQQVGDVQRVARTRSPEGVMAPRRLSAAERIAARDGVLPKIEKMSHANAPNVQRSSKSSMMDFVKDLNQGQNRLRTVVDELKSGKDFSRAELLSLQAEVYVLSEEMNLTSKLVDTANQSIKRVLSQQG